MPLAALAAQLAPTASFNYIPTGGRITHCLSSISVKYRGRADGPALLAGARQVKAGFEVAVRFGSNHPIENSAGRRSNRGESSSGRTCDGPNEVAVRIVT